MKVVLICYSDIENFVHSIMGESPKPTQPPIGGCCFNRVVKGCSLVFEIIKKQC